MKIKWTMKNEAKPGVTVIIFPTEDRFVIMGDDSKVSDDEIQAMAAGRGRSMGWEQVSPF